MIRENSIKEFLLILSLEDRSYKTLHTNDIFQILTELVTIFLQEYYQCVALLHLLLSTGVDKKKSGVAGQQNNFFILQSDFNIEILPKNATKHPVA